jgi:hypothetical protein
MVRGWVLAAALLVGCLQPGKVKNYEVGKEYRVPVGYPMLSTKSISTIGLKAQTLRTELLYTGRSGTVIHLLYREYADDIARAAFSQALTYDLALGNVIAFDRFQIRIVDATNQQIAFVVAADSYGAPMVVGDQPLSRPTGAPAQPPAGAP